MLCIQQRFFIVNHIQIPSIIGVVLAAGKSTRMGTDKAFIQYNQLPQYEYVAQQLSSFCAEVFINGHSKHYETQFQVFGDRPEFKENGPIGGLLTASEKFPSNSIFLVACDYPFLTQASLKVLFDTFVLSQKTVCFRNLESQFIEPLIAIYHVNDLMKLLEFYNSGQTSLRVFLTTINPVILDCNSSRELFSVDAPI